MSNQHLENARDARWIQGPDWDGVNPFVWAFRRIFSLDADTGISFSVTADQRYDLYLDGERIGRGSERGLLNTWFFETYTRTLSAGVHTLTARVWWNGTGSLVHCGHSTVRPGFLLFGENTQSRFLDTRCGVWQAVRLFAYDFLAPDALEQNVGKMFFHTGGRTDYDGRREPAQHCGWVQGMGSGWKDVTEDGAAHFRAAGAETPPLARLLVPAMLPAMAEAEKNDCKLCLVTFLQGEDEARKKALFASDNPCSEMQNDALLRDGLQRLLQGGEPHTIAPHSALRLLLDLRSYTCFYPRLRISGGKGSVLRLRFAESLFLSPDFREKGNRSQWEGCFYRGPFDRFVSGGETGQLLEPLWFQCGRYLLWEIETGEEALVLEQVRFRSVHFPLHREASFSCSDMRWDAVQKMMFHTLLQCAHETYFDCPYFEQLMYAGDTRLECLATYVTTREERLPQKAMLLFDRSRSESGLTLSRVPSRITQVIPPYSLHACMMVYDYALWRRDNEAFIRARLPGIRTVLGAFYERLTPEGLITAPRGWNFVDLTFANGWGVPPTGNPGECSCIMNLHYAWTLKMAAELEEAFGETEFLPKWYRELSARIAAAAKKYFWDEARGLYADDLKHTVWTEHAQCMALCGGFVAPEEQERLGKALLQSTDLVRTSVYYRYYLLEALRILGLPEDAYTQYALWFSFPGNGLTTIPEGPEPVRSDCHGWGAHPLVHLATSLAGIRPTSFGFSSVSIAPQPGPLDFLDCTIPHPKGSISVHLKKENGRWQGTYCVPEGVAATFVLPKAENCGVGMNCPGKERESFCP